MVGLSETRLADEKSTTLASGHLIYQTNKENNTHLGGVAILINKRIKHLVINMYAVSDRVISVTLQLSRRYTMQIIQVYAPTSTANDTEAEQLYEDISDAKIRARSQYTTVMGDFNAKIGASNQYDIPNRGRFSIGNVNERVHMLLNYIQ